MAPRVKKNPAKRTKQQREYDASPAVKKKRAMRNKARRQAEREGRVKKGDGKDVHHKDHNTSNNKKSNLAVISRSKNRSDNLGKGGRPKGSKNKKTTTRRTARK